MNFHFNYPQDFISDEMAIAFLKSQSIELKEKQYINSVQIQVHKNKPNLPLCMTFHVTYQGGGKFHYFDFMQYYNWFEENKFKYL